ncbi:hypothetical protein K501DRAFT_332586 [Backusella circina FSU 941]|nr:hypothetical protein K501DRAFT_332586 [Backusella circina FSU 941]
MTSSFGQPFLCTIPNVELEKEALEKANRDNEKESEQDIKETIERGLELLEPLGNNCLRFYTHQYWIYEYCHNLYVRQFHIERVSDGKVEKEKETASFYLGLYPGVDIKKEPGTKALATITRTAKAKTALKQVGDQRLLTQLWKDGTVCDITEKPRTVEVQFQCDAQGRDRVSSFLELSTCNYQIIISTPRLCEEMSLSHRHHSKPHKIECRPIVPEHLIEAEQNEEEQFEQHIEELKDNSDKSVLKKEEITDLGLTESKKSQVDSKENTEEAALVKKIAALTEQVNRLHHKINSENKQQQEQQQQNTQAEMTLYFMDENGNIVSSDGLSDQYTLELSKFLKKEKIIKSAEKKEQSKDQHENRNAYNQKFMVADH